MIVKNNIYIIKEQERMENSTKTVKHNMFMNDIIGIFIQWY